MSKYTDLEKRLQAIEVEIPKWTGHVSMRIEALEKKEPRQDEPTMDDLGENIERVVLTKKEVRYMEDLEKRLTALEKKQEEPKQVEPDIVYGSTVSVRDQKIKKLMEKETKEQRDDWKFSWITDKEMKDKAIRELLLRYVPSVHYTEVEEKLNKILEGERR